MQTWRDSVQRTCTARNIHRAAARGGGERDSDASNESDALQRSGAGARQSREAGSINERKDAWRRATATARKWQNMAKVHGSPSTCQGRRRMVSDRSRGGAIRSGTWPARWCRSACHQPLRPRRTLGTLQPQLTASWRWRDTKRSRAAAPAWLSSRHIAASTECAASTGARRGRAAAHGRAPLKLTQIQTRDRRTLHALPRHKPSRAAARARQARGTPRAHGGGGLQAGRSGWAQGLPCTWSTAFRKVPLQGQSIR